MGKWSQVRCNCSNRIPMPNSDLHNQPHRQRSLKNMTNKQKIEVEEWRENIQNMYECGHRDGMLVQFWPGEIMKLGLILGRMFTDKPLTFEIFTMVGNTQNYFSEEVGETLYLNSQEVELWLMEVDEFERSLLGHGNLPYQKLMKIIRQLYQDEAKFYNHLKNHLESMKEQGMNRIVPLLENLNNEQKSLEDIQTKQFDVLENVKKLCVASLESGNPIELML